MNRKKSPEISFIAIFRKNINISCIFFFGKTRYLKFGLLNSHQWLLKDGSAIQFLFTENVKRQIFTFSLALELIKNMFLSIISDD